MIISKFYRDPWVICVYQKPDSTPIALTFYNIDTEEEDGIDLQNG